MTVGTGISGAHFALGVDGKAVNVETIWQEPAHRIFSQAIVLDQGGVNRDVMDIFRRKGFPAMGALDFPQDVSGSLLG